MNVRKSLAGGLHKLADRIYLEPDKFRRKDLPTPTAHVVYGGGIGGAGSAGTSFADGNWVVGRGGQGGGGGSAGSFRPDDEGQPA